MSKRTRIANLRKICESNNALSPDILTAITIANSQIEAWRIAVAFEEETGDDLPVNLDEWRRLVRPPVELYFVFKRKRDQGRFVRRMSRDYPDKEVIV